MTAVLCPGQGAQRPGMGRDFADAFPTARAFFDRADEALGFRLSATLWTGTEAEVNRTDVCQPGILVVTTAIWAVLRERGLAPADVRAFAGLSLGEYTAHHLAGTLSFEDAVRLTRRRGEAMQAASDACPSGMAAVMGIDLDGCERCCAEVRAAGGIVVVANLNAPGQIVISGENRALAAATEKLTAAGAKRVIPLPVAGAFHSPVMEPARAALAEALAAARFSDPAVPVVSNVTAEPVRTAAEARDTLARQVTSPVLFEKSLRGMLAAGATSFVEPGPGRTLAGFVKKIDRAIPCANYDAVGDLGGNP